MTYRGWHILAFGILGWLFWGGVIYAALIAKDMLVGALT